MESFKKSWKNIHPSIRKPAVLIIGSLIVIGGIILLPLPGPGWVIIFAGFALLATEFAFAEKVQAGLVQIFKLALQYLRAAWKWLTGNHGQKTGRATTESSSRKVVNSHPKIRDTSKH